MFLVNYKRQKYVIIGWAVLQENCTDWDHHWGFQPKQQNLEITGNGTGFNPRDEAWSLDHSVKTAVLWLFCAYCVNKLRKIAIGDT